MIPLDDNNLQDFELVEFGDKTFDTSTGQMIDGLEALKQTVETILNIERYKFPIYSWNYGIELDSLIGKDYNYVITEMRRVIEEALEMDDRIETVDNFEFEKINKNTVAVSFVVNSAVKINKEMEVM